MSDPLGCLVRGSGSESPGYFASSYCFSEGRTIAEKVKQVGGEEEGKEPSPSLKRNCNLLGIQMKNQSHSYWHCTTPYPQHDTSAFRKL